MAEHTLHLADASAPPGTTEVRLEGGPASIPRRLVISLADAEYGKIKIPHLAGYEHFIRAAEDVASDLFSWAARTKIAE
jgi:hypothetical protein